jgi:hypothetical protein
LCYNKDTKKEKEIKKMIINLYDVIALENANTDCSKRISKTILAENEAKALEIFYNNHPFAQYAKAHLEREIRFDYA